MAAGPRCWLWDAGLKGVADPGGLEVLDAVAEELLLGELLDEDDLRGDENSGLAGLVGRGDLDEGLRIVMLAALEAQSAFGHILAEDNIIAALRMANAGGIVDLDARVLAAIDAGPLGFLRLWNRENGSSLFPERFGASRVNVRPRCG